MEPFPLCAIEKGLLSDPLNADFIPMNVRNIHWDKISIEWVGKEIEGLVDGRKLRPDGFLPDETGLTQGTVYLFHGNLWHGYPEGHEQFDDVTSIFSKRTGYNIF